MNPALLKADIQRAIIICSQKITKYAPIFKNLLKWKKPIQCRLLQFLVCLDEFYEPSHCWYGWKRLAAPLQLYLALMSLHSEHPESRRGTFDDKEQPKPCKTTWTILSRMMYQILTSVVTHRWIARRLAHLVSQWKGDLRFIAFSNIFQCSGRPSAIFIAGVLKFVLSVPKVLKLFWRKRKVALISSQERWFRARYSLLGFHSYKPPVPWF